MYRYFLLMIVSLSLTNGVLAHSPIAYVIPKDGALIREAPATIEIVFTGTSKLVGVSLKKLEEGQKQSLLGDILGSAEGQDIPLGNDHLMTDDKRHLVAIPALTDGTYKTTWRAISEDGHTIKGDFSFQVSPDGTETIAGTQMQFVGEGEIKRIRGQKVTIKHGPIGDVMPAMTMEYEIPEKSGVEGLKRGDTVSFELSESLEIIQISKK